VTPPTVIQEARPGTGSRPPGARGGGGGLPVAALRLPLDPILALATLGICVLSLLTLKAATVDDIPGDPAFYVKRQAVFFVLGAVVMLLVSRVDYSRLRDLRLPIYGLLIALIVAVQLFGSVTRGSRLAIELPFFSFQASELGKVLLVVALSGFAVERARAALRRDTTARIMLLALVPAAMVLLQDLGSGLIYVVIGVAVLFVLGTSWRHFAVLATLAVTGLALGLVALPAAGVEVLKPYQEDRLTAFLNPTDNPREQGYQQNQSRIAIGAGQKTGRGDRATQTRLNFLPEHHTDFVFASVGERWGFVGAALALSLYALLVWRGLRILTIAKDLLGALIAGGIVAMLLAQVFINVGMNVGIMPITGIPLPMLSYGGSSVLSTFLAIGLLQAVYAQGRAAGSKGRAGF
jgi:rod shape determining protein RodA